MDLFATKLTQHEFNKNILNGVFPTDKLFSSYITEDRFPLVDSQMQKLCRYCIPVFSEMQPFLSHVLKEVQKSKDTLSELFVDEDFASFSDSKINSILNTLTSLNTTITNSDVAKKAAAFYPAVTEIDSLLYFTIYIVGSILQAISSTGNEWNGMVEDAFIFLLYIFNTVTKKEYTSSKTINIDRISENTLFLDLVESDWNHNSDEILEYINDDELQKVREVYEEREKIITAAVDEWVEGFQYANKTEKEWEKFLDLLNLLSIKENETIDRVLSPSLSREQKEEAINSYDYYVRNECCGFGSDRDEYESFIKTIMDRFCDASSNCIVQTEKENEPFDLNIASLMLFVRPYTFNYLLLLFHKLRLDENYDSACRFFKVAYECLLQNLHYSRVLEAEDEKTTIEEILGASLTEIESFIEENQDAIDRLSYQTIQKDSVSPLGLLGFQIEQDVLSGPFKEWISSLLNNGNNGDLADSSMISSPLNELVSDHNAVEGLKKQATSWKKDRLGRQIVGSLNIIYLMCDAIEIIMSNDEIKKRIVDLRLIQKIYKRLSRVCADLDDMVYSELDEQEIDMLEYRNIHGIDSRALSSQEEKSAEYEYIQVLESFKEYIKKSTENLEGQSVERIISINTEIRDKISRVPRTQRTDELIETLDNSNQLIRETIIEKTTNNNTFADYKERVLSIIGTDHSLLSTKTIDTLTTAELLFDKYANKINADSGFDYSCISSLYYQALEESYNQAIWKDYADYLNGLVINEKLFSSILFENQYRNLRSRSETGYLPTSYKSRRHYVGYKDSIGIVNQTCMYGSFSIMVEGMFPGKELNHFADFFSQKVGFINRDEMYSNEKYMNILRQFSEGISKSVDFRNNASHGGGIVELQQCEVDKRIVLSDIIAVRDNSVGLIQTLLSLFIYNDSETLNI